MDHPTPDTAVPPLFLIAVFGVAIVVGAVIAYLGITGHIGAGIP
jgi:hypothetical protein